jgi:predicted dehydrogenase
MIKFSFLLLGYSNIAKKRIIGTFLKKKINFSIASKSYRKKIHGIKKQFSNYNDALMKSDANIVYISLPNSLHFYWAKKALLHGYHVIIDKPMCVNISEANILINIAKKNNKLLSESIFYNYHDQVTKLIKIAGGKKKIISIFTNFHIPTPPENSLLMSSKFKGGVVMDMLPYASSINRIFFDEKIFKLKIDVLKNLKKLPITFKIEATYKNKNYFGSFQFGGEYENNITILTKNKKISIDRAFSPPSDVNLKINVLENNHTKIYTIKKDNCFDKYLSEVMTQIEKKNFSYYNKQIRDDQNFRNKIQKKIL